MGGTWTDVLYGDGWDITQTVTHRTDKYTEVKKGYVRVEPAGPGSSHNIWTYKVLKDRATGKEFAVVSFHLEHRKGTEFDKAREKQCKSGIPQIQKAVGSVPIIFTGDANSAKEDTYDGPGRAFKALGYTDVEDTSAVGVNIEYDSYNGLEVKPRKNKRQIDRVFVKTSQIEAKRRLVLIDLIGSQYHTPFGSDHWAVVVDLVIK